MERSHAIGRWLFFVNRGEFRLGDYEEIMNKGSCLSLVSQCGAGVEHDGDQEIATPAARRRQDNR
jgi:hypothetical protein